MILNLVVFIFILLIAYFQYTEGLFSATFSAVCCILAAVLAVSYHELVAVSVFGEHLTAYSLAFSLVTLFAVGYIVLRLIFDVLVPGNLRFPLMFDRIGAGVMGLITGLFATGVAALAAQAMPFGPEAAGFSRYALLSDHHVMFPGPPGRPNDEGFTFQEIKSDTLDPAQAGGLWFPVVDLVLAAESYFGDGGCLSGLQSFRNIHPDYQTELFASRLGLIPNARHTALPGAISVSNLYKLDSAPEIDGELSTVRPPEHTVNSVFKPEGFMLVARIKFAGEAADGDGVLRASPGTIRLCAGGKDFFPIGTLENATTLVANKPDDYLHLESGKGADFVFDVSPDNLFGKNGPGADAKPAPGTFIEFKHLARAEIGGMEIASTITPDPNVVLIRKENLIKAPAPPKAPAKK